MKSSGRFFLLLGLLIQPLVFWPKAVIAYELPRVWLIQRWIEILAVVGMGSFITKPKKKRIDSQLLGLGLGFLLTAIVSSRLGADWPKSVWGNYYRADGLITLIHLMALWLILSLICKRSWIKDMMRMIGMSGFLLSIWVLTEWVRLHWLHQWVPSWNGIIGVSFNQPVFLAGYLTVSLAGLAYLADTAKKLLAKFIWQLGLIGQLIAIGLTRTWGGILGIAVFIIGWRLSVKAKTKQLIIFTSLIFVILITGFFWRKENYLKSGRWAMVSEARERIIVKGFLGWQKRLLLGWGVSNFDYAFQAVDWPSKFESDAYVDKAHSSLLEVLVTTGIVGLLLYIGMIFRAFKILGKQKQKIYQYYLLMLVLWLVHTQTNVISIAEELLFWIVISAATISQTAVSSE